METTKEIPIEYNGKKEKVVIRKLSWPENNALRSKYVLSKIVGGEIEIKMDLYNLRTEALKLSFVSGPFKLQDIDENKVEHDILDKIADEVEFFNKLSPAVKKK